MIAKNQNNQNMKSKHSLKNCIEQLFNFSYKYIIHDTILFDAALLLQKNMMRTGYAEQSIK